MATLAMSDYLENLVIDHMLRAQAHTPTAAVYLAVCSSATSDTALGTEATGNGYARQAITFGAPSLGVSSNSVAASTTFPAGTWTHAAIMTASTGGNILFHGPLSTTRLTTAGQPVVFNIGDIVVGFTTASKATDYLRNKIIDRFLRNQAFTPPTIRVGLYTSATSRTGSGTEVTGGTYSRKTMTLSAGAAGVTANTAVVEFEVPASTITHMAVLDAASAGNMLLESALTGGALPVGNGDIVRFPVGDYDLVVT